MFPEAFRQRIRQQHYLDAEELLHELEKPSPVSIRINRKKWGKNPENFDPVPWCSDGFYLETRPSFTFDPLFHAGCYYPQEASGMFLEQVYKQVAGDRKDIKVLDLCGAPGGKSTQLSALIGPDGLLVANEVIRTRASILEENITRWGLSNTIVTQNDPAAFGRLHGFFDLMLVDAPCSGEGMFRDEAAVREWSEENAHLCSGRQKRILIDVWPALKENGILIYSTCTFNPDENEKNIKWFTDKLEAESVKLDISDYEGITEIGYRGIMGYGFYPGKIRGEGLFISVIRKKRNHGTILPGKAKSSERKVSNEEIRIANEWTQFSADKLIKISGNVIAIAGNPDNHLLLLKNLRIIKSGTRICSVKKKNFLPSHEIAMSVYFRKNVFSTLNLTLEQALSYLRRENVRALNVPGGWIMACYKEINLGFLNNIGSRINNYYPVDWRIRMKSTESSNERILKWVH